MTAIAIVKSLNSIATGITAIHFPVLQDMITSGLAEYKETSQNLTSHITHLVPFQGQDVS